jgi:hypothetical protein
MFSTGAVQSEVIQWAPALALPPRDTRMELKEQQWHRLLGEIDDRHVVPVIGPELLVVETPRGMMPLHRYLGIEIAGMLGLDENQLPDRYSLDDVVREYFRDPRNDPGDLHSMLRDLLEARRWPTPKPLRQLAEIPALEVYLNATFDTLLEDTLNEVRFGGEARTLSFSYSRSRKIDDIPAAYLAEATDRVIRDPAVYYAFGKFSPTCDYGLREEDVLQVCMRLQSRDQRPNNLFDLLKSRSLLMLGCSFPGWLARFFFAAAKGENFLTQACGGVVADSNSPRDPSLVAFLERRKTAVYMRGDAAAMVDELHRRWHERRPAAAAPQRSAPIQQKPDFVFISYAKEDRTYAQLIYDSLQTSGIDAWFDQSNLEPGDDFRNEILRGIRDCSFFLPLVSDHTDTKERRFFRREWFEAVDEAKCRSSSDRFILPVGVDGTPPESRDVPSEFRQHHWARLESGRLPGEVVELMVKRIKDLRRERKRA